MASCYRLMAYLLVVSTLLVVFASAHAEHVHQNNDDHNRDHGHHRIHECANHKLDIQKGVNLHQIHVPYKNHPYEQVISDDENDSMNPNTRRRGLSESETAPIRISAYYDPDTIESRDASQIHELKAVVGAIVNYYENTINVVPVDGTFYMERFCSFYYTVNGYINCAGFSDNNYCQEATVPDSHYGVQYEHYYPTNYSAKALPGGAGISDTDLMLYVTSHATTSCSGSVLAYAGPCAYDQYGRPIAGGINICESFFEEHEWKKDVQTMLHEMTHITIMLSSLWDEFKFPNGSTIPESQVYDDSVDPPLLKSTKLLETVRDHFDCDTAEGLAVQSSSSSHWHTKYAFSENMNPTIYSQQMYYSKFTLALMEDSGWYLPNYEYAEPFYWGKDAGCSFINDEDECLSTTTSLSNFPQFICDSSSDDGCNADHSAPSYCYYPGPDSSDGCSFRTPYFVADPDFQGVCWDVRGSIIDTNPYQGEVWSADSRCIDLVDLNGGSDRGYCMKHECLNWDGTQFNSVNIIFGGGGSENITCSRTEGLDQTTKNLNSVSGKAITCPDIDIVCGTTSGFGDCYWGHWSDTEGKCLCHPGYTGIDCNSKDNSTDVELSQPTTLDPDSVIISDLLCLKGFTSYTTYNGDWNIDTSSKWEPYASYYKSTVDMYVYWNIFEHKWFLVPDLGDRFGTGFCHCIVSEFTEDIRECNGYWECRVNGVDVLQSDSISFFGGCNEPTGSPSPSPTPRPTPRPTDPPTPSPTPAPSTPTAPPTTKAPTVDGYTYPPTSDPSRSPTSPTKSPTNRPTQVYEVSVTVSMGYEAVNDDGKDESDESDGTPCSDLEIEDVDIDWSQRTVIFTNSYNEGMVTLWDMEYTVDVTMSSSFLYFGFIAGSATSEDVLDEFKEVLMTKKYQRQLKRYLESRNITVISESSNDDGNVIEVEVEMELEECFDLKTQADLDNEAEAAVANADATMGTTEYLILTLCLLVCCIGMVIGVFVRNWWKKRNELSEIESPINRESASGQSGEGTGRVIGRIQLFENGNSTKPKGFAPKPPPVPSHLRPPSKQHVADDSGDEGDSDIDI